MRFFSQTLNNARIISDSLESLANGFEIQTIILKSRMKTSSYHSLIPNTAEILRWIIKVAENSKNGNIHLTKIAKESHYTIQVKQLDQISSAFSTSPYQRAELKTIALQSPCCGRSLKPLRPLEHSIALSRPRGCHNQKTGERAPTNLEIINRSRRSCKKEKKKVCHFSALMTPPPTTTQKVKKALKQ